MLGGPAPFSAPTGIPAACRGPRMDREEGRKRSPQRDGQQEPGRGSERRGSPGDAAADGARRRRSRSPQQRGSEHQHQPQEERHKRQRVEDERRTGGGSSRHESRGGDSSDRRASERGPADREQERQQRRSSPERGRSRHDSRDGGSAGRRRDSPDYADAGPASRSRRESPDYGDAGPASRPRGRRSPSPPRRGGWQGERSDVRGGRGWEGDRDRQGSRDWRGRGPPARGGRDGRDGSWGGRGGGDEGRHPRLGPRFQPRVMQRQYAGDGRGPYGRRGELPRSRSPPRHEQVVQRPAGMVADDPAEAADIGACC